MPYMWSGNDFKGCYINQKLLASHILSILTIDDYIINQQHKNYKDDNDW